MNDERTNKERFVCGSCGAIFERMAFYDSAGDDVAKALRRSVNSVMFHVRVVKWAFANLGKSYMLIQRAFQETAIDGLLSDWKFTADAKKRASGEVLPDGAVVNTPPVSGDN